MIKLEVGKIYKTRNGNKTKVLFNSNEGEYPFEADNKECYRADGLWYGPRKVTDLDIISEWQEEPHKCDYAFGSVDGTRPSWCIHCGNEGLKLDWTLAKPGAVVKFRCNGEARIIEHSLFCEGTNRIEFENNAILAFSDTGRIQNEKESPFDIIEIIPAKEEPSPIIVIGNNANLNREIFSYPKEYSEQWHLINKLASQSLPSYESVLEQLKGIK